MHKGRWMQGGAVAWVRCKLGYHADAGRSNRLGVASADRSRLLGAQHPGVGNGMGTLCITSNVGCKSGE